MNVWLEKFVNEKYKKPLSALDLGCGKGYDVACLKHIGWFTQGVDKKTGTNLELPYKAERQFDLVCSNYVLQVIKNKETFIETCYVNLKQGGWLFLHTFSKNDIIFRNMGVDEKYLKNLLKKKLFKNINIREFKVHDYEPGHNHMHNILEITAQK